MVDPSDIPRTGSEAFQRTVLTFEHPGMAELGQHPDATLQIGIDPQDGLPRQTSTAWDNFLSPALDPETLLCMEDASSYVLRDAGGHIVATFAPAEVRSVEGRTVVDRASALARAERHGASLFKLAIDALLKGADVEVTPKRPKCQHYARQMIDFPGEIGHTMMRRFCRANRTDEGEYESVREMMVFACELREPPDAPSAERIRQFDDERVRLGRQRTRSHDFDIAKKLHEAEDRPRPMPLNDPPLGDPAQGGIFNPK